MNTTDAGPAPAGGSPAGDTPASNRSWIAFADAQGVSEQASECVAEGDPTTVATALRAWLDQHPDSQPLVFDAESSNVIELDLRGSVEDVLERLTALQLRARDSGAGASDTPPVSSPAEPPRGRGRPRLGVVAREVTLLPRHWAWLSGQPGGASVALRKLVERAVREHRDADRERTAQESVFRFVNAMAGNAPGFEDAVRALFARDRAGFSRYSGAWPPDVRAHALRLSAPVFAGARRDTTGDDA